MHQSKALPRWGHGPETGRDGIACNQPRPEIWSGAFSMLGKQQGVPELPGRGGDGRHGLGAPFAIDGAGVMAKLRQASLDVSDGHESSQCDCMITTTCFHALASLPSRVA